ncbi:YeeE/YedE thiosulfate transporter family protein [Paracoccus endophyticus]|uniref:YeeE/YedE thiosulfate transporter family protein n=1 Tax=Paracoccus endophyticus TaxID=2233774 RepID=UPI000DD721A3|nr:YeeE/YedE thiosulfate transporter family protein [Paracoccus endophyticus]
MADTTLASAAQPLARRGVGLPFALLVLAAVAATTTLAGARFGLMLVLGLGFGLVLEGLRFGFAGPWRAMILRRDPGGVLAQLLSIALVALAAIPLLGSGADELVGSQGRIGWAMIGGAFVFGTAMQVVLGCGSGTLVNAGSGNAVALVALPLFCIGSLLGTLHLDWWTGLGALPPIVLSGGTGLAVTLALLAGTAAIVLARAAPGTRRIPGRYVLAAVLLAALAIANLVVAGQPWGVVYGLGLWAAKGASAVGVDLSASAFWAAPINAERLGASILTDYTSLTNIGMILGAAWISLRRPGALDQPVARLPARAWVAAALSGLVLGYSSRLAFGCNVGAFYSGIATGSLHGWVWFAAAFAGSVLGLRLRPWFGMEPRQ